MPPDAVPVVIEEANDGRYVPQFLHKHLPKAGARSGGGTSHRRGSVTDEQQALCDFLVARHGAHSVDVWSDGQMHLVRPGKSAKESGASIIVGDEGENC
jgi:hypothetical protein